MRISTVILTTTCFATLSACSSTHGAGPTDGPSPTPDGAYGITY